MSLSFSETHEWIRLDNGTIKVGITDYAQKELGDIVFLEMSKKEGEAIQAKEVLSTIESVKAVSEIYSPVSGTILEINSEVLKQPEIINQAPFQQGWIVKIQLNDSKQLQSFMNESEYRKHIGEE